MSNMLPAFHVFKGHKMEETNLSGDFRSMFSKASPSISFIALSESMIDFDTYISNVGKQPGCYDKLAVRTKIA
jgi:hypothetical protein